MDDCLFCKLARHEIPTQVLFEDDAVLAFPDLHPKAPVHILIVPKQHVSGVNDVSDDQAPLVGKLVVAARQLAVQQGIAEAGYRLQINVGKDGGQTIPHLHVHLLGGRAFHE